MMSVGRDGIAGPVDAMLKLHKDLPKAKPHGFDFAWAVS
jgi:hypothetical protein